MSNQVPSDPPPAYSGVYSNPSDYSAFPQNPPQPYAPAKVDGGSFPAQNYGPPVGSYPSQPYGPGGAVHGTVVVSQPAVTLIQTFRESPVRTRCIHCQTEIITGLHYETGTFTWVICFVLWLIGCGIGCCLIPFCVDGCKDVIHTCPNCRQQIGRYSRM